ncbi:MAG: radical SAM protein, partial [Parasporobacterium sp.]|nr:radical SAM protein [Parasporobacterium sp.]
MADQYSAVKIFRHTDILEKMEKGERFAPLYIRMKPANTCNHHCAYCSYGQGQADMQTAVRDEINHLDVIPWPKMQEILYDISDMGVKAVTFSGGGEPLTYPHIAECAAYLLEHHIDLALISNGQLLSGKIAEPFYHAKWVRISFDSIDADVYTRIRNISHRAFEQVCKNIQDFAANKDEECVLGINFVIGKDNYDRVYEAAKILKGFGVNNVKFAALIDNKPDYHRDIKDVVIEQIHRAIADFGDEHFKIINNY